MSKTEASVDNLFKIYVDVPEPISSYGLCLRKRCNEYGILGDGYCVRCWDKGYAEKYKVDRKQIK